MSGSFLHPLIARSRIASYPIPDANLTRIVRRVPAEADRRREGVGFRCQQQHAKVGPRARNLGRAGRAATSPGLIWKQARAPSPGPRRSWRRRSAGHRPFSGVANAPPHSAVESGARGRRQPAREGLGRASLPLVCWKAGGRKRANRPKGRGRRPEPSPWACTWCKSITGAAMPRRHYRDQQVVTAAARKLAPASEWQKTALAASAPTRLQPVREEWRRVTEGDVRRCTRGVPDTDRGALQPPEHDTCSSTA